MAAVDLKLDKANLDNESSRTASLHGKYLLLFIDETRRLQVLNRAWDKLWHERKLYYLGKAPESVYKENPHPLLVKPIKSEVEEFLRSDDQIQAADAEIKEQELVIKYLHETLKQINQRGFEIRAMIDWYRFKNGENK